MKLKDWEIYNKASKTSPFLQNADRIPASVMDESGPLPGYVEDLQRTVDQLLRLPQEDVELATRILKQFLR